jgi:hypothetical protein
MKAIAIVPGRPETAGLIELPEPPTSHESVLVHYATCSAQGLAARNEERARGHQDRDRHDRHGVERCRNV